MNCQETREKLSTYADKGCTGEARERVEGHLAECPSCRKELDELGALDMMLRNHFAPEPEAIALEALWPSVEERLEGAPPSEERPRTGQSPAVKPGPAEAPAARAASAEQIVFKTSPAMQILTIPERRRPTSSGHPSPGAAAQSAGPSVVPPPAASAWRWPVAFIVSTAIVVVGFIAYKKIFEEPAAQPGGPVVAQSEAKIEGEGDKAGKAPAAEPIASPDSGLKVALAQVGDGGAGGAALASAPGEEAREERSEGKGGGGAKRSKKGEKGEPRARSGKAEEPGVAGGAVAVAAKPSPAKAAGGKKDDLDTLIEGAIDDKAVKPKKSATPAMAAPAPGSDVPEQLTFNQIQTAMGKIKGLVSACYDQYQVEGKADVKVSITNDGTVADASVLGKFFGTDTGTCVIAAVKKAHFPKFSGKPMQFKYPFILQ
jgi:hypothetical protein